MTKSNEITNYKYEKICFRYCVRKKNIRNDFYQFLESTLQYKNNNNNSFLDVATAQLKIHIIV